MAVSHPSPTHPLSALHSPLCPSRTYWTCLPRRSPPLSLWISHIIYFYTERARAFSAAAPLREMNPISPPRLDRKIRLCFSLRPSLRPSQLPSDMGLRRERDPPNQLTLRQIGRGNFHLRPDLASSVPPLPSTPPFPARRYHRSRLAEASRQIRLLCV